MPAQKYEREPEKFPWESDIPQSAFWSDIPKLGQQFLSVYGAEALLKLNLDKNADLTIDERVAYLRALIQQRLAEQEAAVDTLDQFSEEEFKAHRMAEFALVSTYTQVGRWIPASEVLGKMNEAYGRRTGSADPGALHMLGYLAEKLGNYKDAEIYYTKSIPLLSMLPLLGPNSPQVLGSMRALMQILGKRGKVDDALTMTQQGYEIIDTMAGGRFEKYQEEEVEAMDEVREVLVMAKKAGVPVDEDWQPAHVDGE